MFRLEQGPENFKIFVKVVLSYLLIKVVLVVPNGCACATQKVEIKHPKLTNSREDAPEQLPFIN